MLLLKSRDKLLVRWGNMMNWEDTYVGKLQRALGHGSLIVPSIIVLRIHISFFNFCSLWMGRNDKK
jgi:hypothetical protein